MATPLIMHLTFSSLILIAVHVSLLVECRPRLQDPEQQPQQQQSSFYTGAHAATSNMRRFYLELNGSMKKGIDRNFLVTLPVKTDTSNFVSVFSLEGKWFLCLNLKGELYTSRQRDKEDCVFQRIWLNPMNHKIVFYSTSGGQLLKLKGAELRTAHLEPHEPSSALLGPLVKRQRRSEEVNPTDPLRSQSHPSYFATVHKDTSRGHPEQDQAGAVSKETITSCDDPLRVLQASGPVSPVKTNIADGAEQD